MDVGERRKRPQVAHAFTLMLVLASRLPHGPRLARQPAPSKSLAGGWI